MEKPVYTVLLALLRSAICKEEICSCHLSLFKKEMLPQLLRISRMHDVAHIVSVALRQNSLIDNNDTVFRFFRKAENVAICRSELINYEYNKLYAFLEKERIFFVPLKGIVIRNYYPQPWMRTSSDVDILVQQSQLDGLIELLIEQLSYKKGKTNAHDISMYTPSGVHIEFHYDLIEEGCVKNAAKVLHSVWESVSLRENCSAWCEMPQELFYFYQVAHMAKHFGQGGCGIRFFMDLWLLDSSGTFDRYQVIELFKRGDLLQFAETSLQLSKMWFGDEPENPLLCQMQDHVIQSGIYGTVQNRVILQQTKTKSRFGYLIQRIFLPYNILKFHYPVLQKKRYLTPLMQIRRWGKLLFCTKKKKWIGEVKINRKTTQNQVHTMHQLMKDVGL